jgi:hypothetical protein
MVVVVVVVVGMVGVVEGASGMHTEAGTLGIRSLTIRSRLDSRMARPCVQRSGTQGSLARSSQGAPLGSHHHPRIHQSWQG